MKIVLFCLLLAVAPMALAEQNADSKVNCEAVVETSKQEGKAVDNSKDGSNKGNGGGSQAVGEGSVATDPKVQ